jgi:hypothetical protein
MKWTTGSLTALVSLLAAAALPERAYAIRIPVIYGSGDTITYVADLPANSPARTSGRLGMGGNPTKVGYRHYRFHIFWIPFWTSTSEGQFAAYDESGILGTWYHPLGTDPQTVSKQTGVPVSELKIPWRARNPWGLYLIGTLVLLGVVGGVHEKWTEWRMKAPGNAQQSENAKEVALLLQDPRYQQALEVMKEQYAKQPTGISPSPGRDAGAPDDTADAKMRDAVEAAVQHLVSVGVPREEAEFNLTLMLLALAESPQQ